KDGGSVNSFNRPEHQTQVVVYAPYYGFTVIAAAGGPNMQLSSLGDSPSINDQGKVAFTGYFGNASGIFASDGTIDSTKLLDGSQTALITRNETLSTRDFGRAASINNDGEVSGREYVKPALSTYIIGYQLVPGPFGPMLVPVYATIADPPQTIIRVWDKDGSQLDTLANV